MYHFDATKFHFNWDFPAWNPSEEAATDTFAHSLYCPEAAASFFGSVADYERRARRSGYWLVEENVQSYFAQLQESYDCFRADVSDAAIPDDCDLVFTNSESAVKCVNIEHFHPPKGSDRDWYVKYMKRGGVKLAGGRKILNDRPTGGCLKKQGPIQP